MHLNDAATKIATLDPDARYIEISSEMRRLGVDVDARPSPTAASVRRRGAHQRTIEFAASVLDAETGAAVFVDTYDLFAALQMAVGIPKWRGSRPRQKCWHQ